MIGTFTLLFLASVLSLSLHRSWLLKPFALVVLVGGFVLTMGGSTIPLSGFGSNDKIQLFELVLEVVLFAFVLHEDEDISITQTLFLATASLLLLEANTLLSFVISFEALSLISVILLSDIKTKADAEGGVKMFVAGGIATAILFFGLTLYVMGGGILLAPLARGGSFFMDVGGFVILVGVFYKLTIVPFHGWALDTYSVIRHSYGALLSGVAKSVAALAVFQIFSGFLVSHIDIALPYLAFFALLTITLGNFFALFSNNIARILSYSSVTHAGYILVAFVSVESGYASGGLLYMVIAYIFMQTGAFLALDILRKNYGVVELEDLKGIAASTPYLSFFFTLQLLSLAGIPLLAGFLAKSVVFYSAVDVGLWWLALGALLNSALSVGYYAWIIKHIYFDKKEAQDVIVTYQLPVVAQFILALGSVVFGVYASLVFNTI
jgi:NADH-quinone oxidoreductase subunit N